MTLIVKENLSPKIEECIIFTLFQTVLPQQFCGYIKGDALDLLASLQTERQQHTHSHRWTAQF